VSNRCGVDGFLLGGLLYAEVLLERVDGFLDGRIDDVGKALAVHQPERSHERKAEGKRDQVVRQGAAGKDFDQPAAALVDA
jgi:hypothetical protein